MDFIKEYSPLLVAMIGASLAYLYGRRNNNFVNFHGQAKVNLENLLEPMLSAATFDGGLIASGGDVATN